MKILLLLQLHCRWFVSFQNIAAAAAPRGCFFFFFLIFTPFYFDHPSSRMLLLDWICPFLLLLLLKIVDNNNNRSQTIKKKLKFNQIDAHDPGFFIHNDRRVFFYFSEFRKIKKTMHACFQMKKKTKMLTTCAYDYQHDS